MLFNEIMWIFSLNIFLGIFVWSILECAFIPSPAEAVVIPIVLLTRVNPIYVGLFGCMGSIIGALIDYYAGKKGYRFVKKYVKNDIKSWSQKYLKRFERFGEYSLIVAMTLGRIFPLSLKPLLFLAGMIDMNKILFTTLIAVTSFIRYYAIAYITLQLT